MPTSNKNIKSYTQADGVVTIQAPAASSPVTQVSFDTDSTAGTVSVRAKHHPQAAFETLYEEDGTTVLSIDLTDLKSFQLYDKWVYELEFTPSGVDATYTPCVLQGRMLSALN